MGKINENIIEVNTENINLQGLIECEKLERLVNFISILIDIDNRLKKINEYPNKRNTNNSY